MYLECKRTLNCPQCFTQPNSVHYLTQPRSPSICPSTICLCDPTLQQFST
ncbi:hypothetical protein ACRRTK_021137 [Alexandromys fortis]